MSTLTLVLPIIGQPDSTEDAKLNTALTAIQTWANGNVDQTNITPQLVTATTARKIVTGTATATFVPGTNGTTTATSIAYASLGGTPVFMGLMPVSGGSIASLMLVSPPVAPSATAASFYVTNISGSTLGSSTLNIAYMAIV